MANSPAKKPIAPSPARGGASRPPHPVQPAPLPAASARKRPTNAPHMPLGAGRISPVVKASPLSTAAISNTAAPPATAASSNAMNGSRPPSSATSTQQRVEMIRQYYSQLMSNLRSVTMQLQQVPPPPPGQPDPSAHRRQVLVTQQERLKRTLQEFTERVMKPTSAGSSPSVARPPLQQQAASAISPPSQASTLSQASSYASPMLMQSMPGMAPPPFGVPGQSAFLPPGTSSSAAQFAAAAAAYTHAQQQQQLAQMQHYQNTLMRQRQVHHQQQQQQQQQQQMLGRIPGSTAASLPPDAQPLVSPIANAIGLRQQPQQQSPPSTVKPTLLLDVPSREAPSSASTSYTASPVKPSTISRPSSTLSIAPPNTAPAPSNGPSLHALPCTSKDVLDEVDELGRELIERAIALAKHRIATSPASASTPNALTAADMLVALRSAGIHPTRYEIEDVARINGPISVDPSAAQAGVNGDGNPVAASTAVKRSNTGPHMARMSQLKRHLVSLASPPPAEASPPDQSLALQ